MFYFAIIVIVVVIIIIICKNKKSTYVGFDTRYIPSEGKIVQITKESSTSEINIINLKIYSNYYYGKNDINAISALVKPYPSSDKLFSNVLDNDNSTMLNIANNSEILIHIDVGSTNQIITGISFTILATDNQNNILGLKIRVIKIDETNPFNMNLMRLTSEVIIDQNMVNNRLLQGNVYYYIINLPYNKNDTLPADVIISHELLYNSSNKYLTTYYRNGVYYQIPYMIYNLSNGRKVKAKKMTPLDDIDKAAISDGNLLMNIDTNENIAPVQIILNPISARYIQIIITSDIHEVIKVTVYNSSRSKIKEINNPSLTYINTDPIYNRYLTDISNNNGFIFLDLEQNTSITFINVTTVNTQTLVNGILNLFDSNLTKVFTYSFVNTSTDNYVITDYNKLDLHDGSIPNVYNYPNCSNLGICNTVAPDSKYFLSDDRCFKSKINSVCDSTCMSELLYYPSTPQASTISTAFESCLVGTNTTLPTYKALSIWFDASDIRTLFKDSSGTDRVLANNDPVAHWNSKGAVRNFYMTRVSGNAVYTQNLFGNLPAIKFNNFMGQFSDGTITQYNNNGITMFVVVNNFHGMINNTANNNGSFWFQAVSGNKCGYNSISAGTNTWNEQMGTSNGMSSIYTSNDISNNTIVYAVRADASTNYSSAYFNLLIPFKTVTYGTTNLAQTAKVGGDNSFNSNICEFRLYQRRMSDLEFSGIFNDLKLKWIRLLLHYNASEPNVLFQDDAGVNPAYIGNTVRHWKTTKNSLLTLNSNAINTGAITVVSILGKNALSFNGGAMSIPINFSTYNDMTYIAAIKITGNPTSHVLNMSGLNWLNTNGKVVESFFNSTNEYTTTYNTVNALPFIFYIVSANSNTGVVNCYFYNISLINVASLTYYNYMPDNLFSMAMGNINGVSNFTLLEFRLYNTALNVTDINNEISNIKINWPRPEYLLHFDASDTTTMFSDFNMTIPAVKLNDFVYVIKSTAYSKFSVDAVITNSNNNFPYITSFSSGMQCVKFNSTYGYYRFKNTDIYKGITSATMIWVAYAPLRLKTATNGPLYNMGGGLYPFRGQIRETFFANPREEYTATDNNFSDTLIYAVIANSVTKQTKCYSFNKNNASLNTIATLTYYDTSVKDLNAGTAWHYIGDTQNANITNNMGMAEIIIFPSALTEASLLTEMIKLRTKWNF